MNIKKNLITKKNVVNMLALILMGINTNKKIHDALKRKESTISEHLAPLNKEGLIYVSENKKNNEKNYEIDEEKIAEIFFKNFLKKEELLKYKKNDFVSLTFAGIISAKKVLLENKPKEFDRISLLDIFEEAKKYFGYRGKELDKGYESVALKGYQSKDKITKDEFKDFLKLIYQYIKKERDEERLREEKIKMKEGETLVESVSLEIKKI